MKGVKSNCTGDLQNWANRFSDSCLMVLRVREAFPGALVFSSSSSSSGSGTSESSFSASIRFCAWATMSRVLPSRTGPEGKEAGTQAPQDSLRAGSGIQSVATSEKDSGTGL
jgi:hypothetical protein